MLNLRQAETVEVINPQKVDRTSSFILQNKTRGTRMTEPIRTTHQIAKRWRIVGVGDRTLYQMLANQRNELNVLQIARRYFRRFEQQHFLSRSNRSHSLANRIAGSCINPSFADTIHCGKTGRARPPNFVAQLRKACGGAADHLASGAQYVPGKPARKPNIARFPHFVCIAVFVGFFP